MCPRAHREAETQRGYAMCPRAHREDSQSLNPGLSDSKTMGQTAQFHPIHIAQEPAEIQVKTWLCSPAPITTSHMHTPVPSLFFLPFTLILHSQGP